MKNKDNNKFIKEEYLRIGSLEREVVSLRALIDYVYNHPSLIIKHWIKQSIKRVLPKSFVEKVLKPTYRSFKGKKYKIFFSKYMQLSLSFKKIDKPKASIIILAYNKWDYTYQCLKSIKKNCVNVDYEIVLLDNASSDNTQKKASRIKNINYIRKEDNLGFVRGCNYAAGEAKGEYLVFLNNDTIVRKNWLEALLNTFNKHEDVGLVGSKLIYPDGKLQEAGGIIWKDYSAWNYGRGDNPDSYKYNYLREADYCSGASIMIKKEIFSKLGGFDEVYSPGYYEDTDLAFKVRKFGLKVYYQPASVVVHFEGITSGTDLTQGMKRYQITNQKTFYKKWDKVLQSENFDSSEGPFLAKDRLKNKKVILYIDHQVPKWDQDAGSFITFEYLKILLELNYKIIFWPQDQYGGGEYTKKLQQMGVEVVYDESFSTFIIEAGRYIDTTILSRPHVAQEFIDRVKEFTNSKIHFIAHDLHYLRETRQAETNEDQKLLESAENTKKIEHGIMEKVDLTWLFSSEEVEIIKKDLPKARLFLCPWVEKEIGQTEIKPFDERGGVFFLGGFNHKPNVDAVKWLKEKIYPQLKEKEVVVTIVGSSPPKEIQDLEEKSFIIKGFMSDEELDDMFNKAKVFISPLRFGAGFKGKIAKSISRGLPVVSTSIGAEGMGLEDKVNVLISDDPKEFADNTAKLCMDEKLWEKISKGELEHAKENYTNEKAKDKFKRVL
jgi:GT2 family glycosyltransferase